VNKGEQAPMWRISGGRRTWNILNLEENQRTFMPKGGAIES